MLLPAHAALAQFSPLRFDDDFIAQRRLCSADAGGAACWKDRPLGDAVRLSIGGDLRLRYERAGHPRYGLDPEDRWGVLMQRGSVFADLRLDGHWRGFAQLASSRTNGRAAGPSPVDENRLDPSNLFVEWQSSGHGKVSGVRIGVQELLFGSGRAIDPREGPNVRRSFEGVRAYASGTGWRLDAFDVAPRQHRLGSLDDARSRTQALRGIYATRAGAVTSVDVYLLDFEDTAARYNQGAGHERRWSAGTRLFGTQAPWDWNAEFLVQGGHFGAKAIRAWSLATDTGYTFREKEGQPRVALLFAVASGDKDPNDDRLNTLNSLYPRGNYFGDEATLGPRNFANIHPALSMRVAPGLQLTTSLDFFWRYSTRDGVYAPNGSLIRGAGDSRARYVATIASAGLTWVQAAGWSTTAVIAYAQPGAFLRETGAKDVLRFMSVTAQYRF